MSINKYYSYDYMAAKRMYRISLFLEIKSCIVFSRLIIIRKLYMHEISVYEYAIKYLNPLVYRKHL